MYTNIHTYNMQTCINAHAFIKRLHTYTRTHNKLTRNIHTCTHTHTNAALRRKKLLKQSTYTKSSTIDKSSSASNSPHGGRRKSAPNKAFHKVEKTPLTYTSSYTNQEEERSREEGNKSVKVHMV